MEYTEQSSDIISLFLEACRNNDKELVVELIEQGADDLNYGSLIAFRNNHSDLVELLIRKGSTSFEIGFQTACKNNNIDFALFIIEKGFDINKTLAYATRYDNYKLVCILVEMGAKDFTCALQTACRNGNISIAEYLLDKMPEKGEMTMNDALYQTCIGHYNHENYRELILLLLENGATDLDRLMKILCSYRSIPEELVIFLLEKGADIRRCGLKVKDVYLLYLQKKGIKEFGRYRKRLLNINNRGSFTDISMLTKMGKELANYINKY